MLPPDPYSTLGLKRGATMREVKAAYRRLAKECHPDHHPNDPERTKRFREIAEAYERIERGAGRLPDEELEEPPPRTGLLVTIWLVAAPAGTGKTREWARSVAEGRMQGGMIRAGGLIFPPRTPRHIICASPTIELIKETAAALKEFGAGSAVVVIHSQDGGPAGLSVNQKLVRFFSTLKPGADVILLCTHAAVEALPDTVTVTIGKGNNARIAKVFDKADWDLTIDEAPEVLNFIERNWAETWYHLTRYVEAVSIGGGLMELHPRDERASRGLARIRRTDDDGLDNMRPVADAIIDPYRSVIVTSAQWNDLTHQRASRSFDDLAFGGRLDIAIVTRPAAFQAYNSVSMMGARIRTTMAHVLWSRLFNVEFKRHPLQDRLPARHPNGKRLVIHYLFEERATRDFLSRKAEDGGTMFYSACDKIARFFARQKYRRFIWTAPLDRAGSQHGVKSTFFRVPAMRRGKATGGIKTGDRPFHPDLRLPGRTHGLNRYRDIHNAVLLSIVNFAPEQYQMLHRLGLTDREIDRAFGHNIAYQDALRCSLRDLSARDRVHLVVVDKPTATDLGAEFPGCRVERLPDALVPKRAARKKPGPAATGDKKTLNAARQRAWRARRKTARDTKEEQDRET